MEENDKDEKESGILNCLDVEKVNDFEYRIV